MFLLCFVLNFQVTYPISKFWESFNSTFINVKRKLDYKPSDIVL